jgi:anaerobic selenocysteine-containing dehydrogenase
MREILPEDTVMLNPSDSAKLGLADKDLVMVQSAEAQHCFPLQTRSLIQPGFAYIVSTNPVHFGPNPCPVHIRRNHV